jgi:hypothetical protein
MRFAHDGLLLLLAGAALLFGGGVGCDPALSGVDFRAKSRLSDPDDRTSPLDWYMAFDGKKAPGDGSAELPYPLLAPLGIEARMGVFDASKTLASQGSAGCVGLRNAGAAEEYRLCVRQEAGAMRVESSLDGATADCPAPASAGETNRVRLELSDDGVNAVARYRCPGLGFVQLTSVASLWSEGEAWHAFVSADGVAKGGQVAFDDFRLTGAAPPLQDPTEIPFVTFDALRSGIEAVYAIEDGEFSEAASLAGDALGKIEFAANSFTSDRAAQKALAKAASSHTKLLESAGSKYVKSFVKTAGLDAAALEALEPLF